VVVPRKQIDVNANANNNAGKNGRKQIVPIPICCFLRRFVQSVDFFEQVGGLEIHLKRVFKLKNKFFANNLRHSLQNSNLWLGDVSKMDFLKDPSV
jgi:hypothetical protein